MDVYSSLFIYKCFVKYTLCDVKSITRVWLLVLLFYVLLRNFFGIPCMILFLRFYLWLSPALAGIWFLVAG